MFLEIRNKYMSIKIQKMKFLTNVTQRCVFPIFVTLSAMIHSQNFIGN